MISHWRPNYEKETAHFWSSSYESALHRYARYVIAEMVDRNLAIPDEISLSLGAKSKTCIKVTLNQSGSLKDWLITNSSGNETFEKIAEKAVLGASPGFPNLPLGSALQTTFMVHVGIAGPEVIPELFYDEDEFAGKAAGQFGRMPEQVSYRIFLSRNNIAIEGFASNKVSAP